MCIISDMCLAVPGKILKIDGRKVTVSYPSENREVLNSGIEIKAGDYVMVQMGIIVKKIPEKEAQIAIKAWIGR